MVGVIGAHATAAIEVQPTQTSAKLTVEASGAPTRAVVQPQHMAAPPTCVQSTEEADGVLMRAAIEPHGASPTSAEDTVVVVGVPTMAA